MKSIDCLIDVPYPSLGLDLDGCIDECPIFFQLLTKWWLGKVFIISYRHDKEKTIQDLDKFNIKYNELILVSSFEEKAKVIQKEGILIYFDDQPEMLQNISNMVNVMLVRNGGNFDFDDKKWIMSQKTGKFI